MFSLLLALQVAAAQPQSPSGTSVVDSLLLRVRVANVTRDFLDRWTAAWRHAQDEHPPIGTGEYIPDGNERAAAAHCHWDISSAWVHRHIITGSIPAQPTCPRFLRSDESLTGDERLGIDNGLMPRDRRGVQGARTRLRAVLDSAAQALPQDIELARYRVRFALDAGDVSDAVNVALSCGYAMASCELLQGLILYRLGDVVRAD